MKKLARLIVKYRLIFAVLFVALAIAGAFLSTHVKQNYDMSKYLPYDTDTSRGLAVMEKEFGLSNNILLMMTMDEGEVGNMRTKLSSIHGVQLVTLDSYKNGKALFMITLSGDEYSDETKATLAGIRSLLESEDFKVKDSVLGGSAVLSQDLETAIKVEMPIIMAIAIAIIFLVLLLTSHSWLEPIVFALVLLCAVLINMGSNFIFGEISYITFAVSAILQIALAMDYSIILLHSYSKHKSSGLSKEDALVEALAYNMRPISSSGLTTIAGLIALLFMSFTIGFDIGIVLAKGILVSLLSVIFFMPSLILIFSKPLEKTQHKPLPIGGGKIAKASVSMRMVFPIIMVLIIVGAYVLQLGNVYTFGWANSESQNTIGENFGYVNQAVVIVDNKYADDRESHENFIKAVSRLKNDDGNPAVKSVNSWATLELTADTLMSNIGGGLDFDNLLSVVGSGATVGDVVALWDECDGDIFELPITEDALAYFMSDRSEAEIHFIYQLVKGSSENLTLGQLVDKLYAICRNPASSGIVGDLLSPQMQDVIELMHDNKGEISEAAGEVLDPLVGELSTYDSDTPISDIELGGDIFGTLCRALFGGDTFRPAEFFAMWNDANCNIEEFKITESMAFELLGIPDSLKIILSLILPDFNLTLGEFVEFVYRNNDSPLIKNLLGEQIVGVCTLAYLSRDVLVPYVNDTVTGLMSTLRSTFVGEEHSRIILLMDLPKDGDATFAAIDSIKDYANLYFGNDNYVAGESMTVKDISGAFRSDLLKINLVTVLSIFIIIAILFRSVSLPVILVFVIQGAIWITMASYAIFGIPIFFMSYIICICIQMGATIDYGILIASNFRRNRQTMDRMEAIVESLKSAMPTVLTSGLIIIAASFIIGFVSTIMPIYSIGKLLGVGTIISILLILFLLPALLYIFDKVISHTTWDGVKTQCDTNNPNPDNKNEPDREADVPQEK